MNIEAEKISNEELLDEHGNPIEPPEIDAYAAYDNPEDFVYDSLVGFCQMISVTYKKQFRANEAKSNASGVAAIDRCIVNIKKRVDGIPYIETVPEQPSMTDHYEHNLMFVMGKILEPAIPDEAKPDNERDLSELFIEALEKVKALIKSQL